MIAAEDDVGALRAQDSLDCADPVDAPCDTGRSSSGEVDPHAPSRVVVGSVAVREPETVGAWIARFGAERIYVALDLHLGDDGRWRPALDAWQVSSDADFATLVHRLLASGLRHALCTDIAHDGMSLIEDIVEIYDNYEFTTQVLVASTRGPLHIVEAAKLGADICTCPPAVIESLFKHPLTDIGLEKFIKDWEKSQATTAR